MSTYQTGILVRDFLMEPEKKALQGAIDVLVRKNGEGMLFMSGGTVYKHSTYVGALRGAPGLAYHLGDELFENLSVFREVKAEVQAIWQALIPFVNLAQDNGLPEALHSMMGCKNRTEPFADVLARADDSDRVNWWAVEDKLAYFLSIRMIL